MRNILAINKTIKKYLAQSWFHDGVIYYFGFDKDLNQIVMVIDAPWEWDMENAEKEGKQVKRKAYYKNLYGLTFKGVKYFTIRHLLGGEKWIQSSLDEFLYSKIKSQSAIVTNFQKKFKRKMTHLSIECLQHKMDIIFERFAITKIGPAPIWENKYSKAKREKMISRKMLELSRRLGG